jgi:hypothetical protein
MRHAVHVSETRFHVMACNYYNTCLLPHHTILLAFETGQATYPAQPILRNKARLGA